MATRDATNPTLGSRLYNLRKARKLARERFLAGRKAERQYGLQLRRVARQISDLVLGMAPAGTFADPQQVAALIDTLNRYSETLGPWAEAVAKHMVWDMSRRDASAWEQYGKEIGRTLRREINAAPTGAAMQESLANQVELIKSLPLEAAQRVHKLTLEGITGGTRAPEIAKEIMRSGEVAKSQAMTIARTEVSRTAAALTQARAEFVGSTHYIWRTTRDGAVRPSHRAMEGQAVRWDLPPVLDHMQGHAGEFPNCRCYAEPVLPDRL
jgi:SPP1 gp7 family putative phage head morphogenesis protein